MRIANMKFMVFFPNLSAAFCQVNFSRRLRYQNVKRRQTAAVYPVLMPCPAMGMSSGAATLRELDFARELEIGAAIYMCARGAGKSCKFLIQ